jgi:hypothetical protein
MPIYTSKDILAAIKRYYPFRIADIDESVLLINPNYRLKINDNGDYLKIQTSPFYLNDKLPSELDPITIEELIGSDKFVVEIIERGQVYSITKDELVKIISTIEESQVINLVEDLNERLQGYGLFGSGIDGDITLTEDDTLTEDKYYGIVTVNADVIIHLNGFRFYAFEYKGTGNLTLSDKGADGGNAIGSNGGIVASVRNAGYLPTPNQGASGGNQGASASNGTSAIDSIGSDGIAGKNSAGYSGGIAGAITPLSPNYGSIRNFFNLQLYRVFAPSDVIIPLGHAGNGGSAGGTTGGGGASGNNGGYAMVFIRTISGNLIIDARGGKGGDGSGDGSGADGGNGGIIGFIYHLITGTVTHLYIGGEGGTGDIPGDAGLTGILIELQL